MRSRNQGGESSSNGHFSSSKPVISHAENEKLQEDAKKKNKPHRKEDEVMASATVKRHSKSPGPSERKNKKSIELSKEDLIKLLSIMEGELQAREDVIHMLKTEKTKPEVLEAHYGSAAPENVLRVLHRDAILAQEKSIGEDVYEKPISELDRLEEKQKETYRRMLEQLLLAEKCHRRTVYELENEKHKHTDYMNKSDDFTNLLEQERERLKKLLEQEKVYQARKEKEHTKRINKLREELVKLKSFALMLVDERQMHIEQLGQQSQKIQDLTQKLKEEEEKLKIISAKTKEDGQKLMKLEAELEHKTSSFSQEHEEMTAKLGNQESHNRQLRLKLVGLTRRIEELEETNKNLQKAEEELQELRDKIAKGECGNSSLMAEVENLRKRVLEMEGKDEEITKTESQCKELKNKLQEEEHHSKELKLEVEKLQKRMSELEKLEEAFSKSKSECTQLHLNLEKEKNLTKDLINELEVVKTRVKDLETSESKLEKAEISLKDDLTKLKSFTVMLVDERKNMMEKIKQEEKKVEGLNKNFKVEQGKVMDVTEKLIEESKKFLKLKSEMEEKVSSLTKERDELIGKLRSEEEKSSQLSCRVDLLKKRIDGVEEVEREITRGRTRKGPEHGCHEDNKIKELTVEIERLKKRLKQLEVVEGDLMKTEDEYDQLEQKFRTEQDKANFLSQQLEEMKLQIAKTKAIEKGEVVSQEAELRHRFRLEEAKSRDLKAEVQALKEKIHELMNKEDQLSQLQVDYSVLQQRFMEEENKNKSMGQEVLNLTRELELSKRYSRALRPSINGRRMVDVPVTSTGVQTDAVSNEAAEEETPAVFIRKSFQEENHIMSNLRQVGLKKPMERSSVLERYPPAANELAMRKSWIPWMKKREPGAQATPDKGARTHGSPAHPGEVVLSPKQGQPLHIRVTPDHENSTATLEITSPTAEEFFSSTTVIPTLGNQKPRITIIPSPNVMPQKGKGSESPMGPDRSMSPVTITTFSREKSPEGGRAPFADRPASPIQIMTVSTSAAPAEISVSPQSQDMTMGRAVFKVTPEKQTVPTPIRKYNANANIITTEDNKIHIHLGSQFKRSPSAVPDGASPVITVRPVNIAAEKEVVTGTVLRSPRNNLSSRPAASKVTSTITITPVTTSSTRGTQSVTGQDGSSSRPTPTRIPVSKGMKAGKPVVAAPGAGNVTKFEPRAETQSMKIELKKSSASSSASLGGGQG
ncbi:filamin-A-interacting protein 1 isoform X1 [Manacus vitellinus]|uniref:filamin-A-interacting protein 1 isoform X1 n=2 Tax=Manacus vitellinus TaxID=328815 RepID=UPI0004EFE868|nr:filamin-A-interacting protein 1 isoform X1 [Manacus vitellinus]XP_029818540.1 filamin-A-interacting protein 1 isoform X1 [Manacus vitellinus]XP_051633972.1 filamin-A-interacting protein 1 isoform X1 [Manacus candei]XP_051633973.1 filamin-A-interacting protein 1 isoform X1 [Manacus candei]XP_051633974.1 filamin-A-interacting protein 1 isoform X1 [Manacus candei]XP_051633975.1 filamin-A-interacting protein 1 isoform X1 [Manacus candei]XP_051633976.1 filamin-A-interacting protein 1 isoform X1